jgi:hypothetical protein
MLHDTFVFSLVVLHLLVVGILLHPRIFRILSQKLLVDTANLFLARPWQDSQLAQGLVNYIAIYFWIYFKNKLLVFCIRYNK